MKPRNLEELLSGAEPALLRNWLAPVKFGRPLTEGSVTPALGNGMARPRRPLGSRPGPQPIDFAFVSLVLSDYVPGVTAEGAANLVSEIVAAARRDAPRALEHTLAR